MNREESNNKPVDKCTYRNTTNTRFANRSKKLPKRYDDSKLLRLLSNSFLVDIKEHFQNALKKLNSS